MKEYDLICIGTGSGMSIVQAMINENPKLRVAVIDKDEPGGICLTKGCIPSKILLYPAELVRTIQKAPEFGIKVDLKSVNFKTVMDRMRNLINKDINMIRQGLSHSPNIDYFHASAEFVSPYVLKVDEKKIKAKMIILCTGSKPAIPPIKGINNVSFQTSDSVLEMDQLPPSIGIVGGGYIAAEFGHFFSAMGSKVTVIGRNPRFLPQEEPEVSALAKRKLKEHLTLLTNHEVLELSNASSGKKRIIARNRTTGDRIEVDADEIVIAVGRSPNTDILNPEKGGIATDERGWIKVDEHLETSKPNVWALG
ncbi:FAD-dependent oxidoreductase, partial [Candidatus Bathyarchaeota archaeon]|nr:FAD-dependent oxidoreductase [Candidatus Bathyarchaeota archaeon]